MLILVQKMIHALNTSTSPSRLAVLAPTHVVALKPFVEVAKFSPRSNLFTQVDGSPFFSTCEMSLLLVMNLDPINWISLVDSLAESFAAVTISKHTDSLFRERTPLEHVPRVLPRVLEY